MIEKRSNNFEGLIDLTDSKTNLLEKFEIKRNFVENLNKNDFKKLTKLINSKELVDCDFEFNSLHEIVENQFYDLNGIKKLSLQIDEQCLFQDGCFNGLNSLESLFIEGIGNTTFSRRFFYGLSNLTHLEISYSSISILENKFFDEIPKLNDLKFYSNNLKTICNSAFSGIKNLTILELSKNRIISVQKNAFSNMLNLKFLSLQNFVKNSFQSPSFLNRFKNLECLVLSNQNIVLNNLKFLDLPNLKFLSISSTIIPQLPDNNLIFLAIKNLNQLSNNSFISCRNLKGLSLRVNRILIDKFQKLKVLNLQSVEYFSIKFEFENEKENIFDCEKIFGLKKQNFVIKEKDITIVKLNHFCS